MFATHFASLSCTLTEAWSSTGDPTPSCWRSCTGSSSPPSSQSTSCTSPSWRWCPARSRRQSRARCASFRPSPWSTKWAERRLWEHRRSSSSSTPSPSSGRLGWVLKHLALWKGKNIPINVLQVRLYLGKICPNRQMYSLGEFEIIALSVFQCSQYDTPHSQENIGGTWSHCRGTPASSCAGRSSHLSSYSSPSTTWTCPRGLGEKTTKSL